MILYRKNILIFLLLTLIFSCQKHNPKITEVLRLAGENRNELEKVLNYYTSPRDSLKDRAARFLIENMSNKFSMEGRGLDNYVSFLDSLAIVNDAPDKSPFYWINLERKVLKSQELWSKAEAAHGNVKRDLKPIYDAQTIKADYLIENIDYAFKAWGLPWARHLSFEEFCEHILPYRVSNEALAPWRKAIFENADFSIFQGIDDPVEVCKIVNEGLSKKFYFNELFYQYPRALNYFEILKIKSGSCREQSNLAQFTMRALGVPVTNDFIYKWADNPAGHDMNSILDREGRYLFFQGTESSPGEYAPVNSISKIFRRTYFLQPILFKESSKELIPSFFKQRNFIDVTKQHIPVTDIALDLNSTENKHIFLCTFDNSNWVPVAMAIRDGSIVTFKDIGLNIVYLPVIIDIKGNIHPISNPILVDQNENIRLLEPNSVELEILTLYRKFPLKQRHIDRASNLMGGRFQGSNYKDFRNARDLFVVKERPISPMEFVPRRFNTNIIDKFRYVRYLLPPILGEGCNIADVSFYSESGMKLQGLRYGSKWVKNQHLEIAFNGRNDDYLIALNNDKSMDMVNHVIFIEDSTDFDDIWLAMDLGKRQIVKEVGLTPRSDTNNIYDDCLYELFYWDNQWISMGTRENIPDKLVFEDVSTNTLFLLRNLTKGKEERIFVYEDGVQVFY